MSRPGCGSCAAVRRLTLENAAHRAGLSPAHLSRLETGRRQPSLPMLLGLARIYGTTVSELLGEAAAGARSHRPGGPDGARRGGRLDLPPGGRARPGHAAPAGPRCRTARRATSSGSTRGRSGSIVLDGRLRLSSRGHRACARPRGQRALRLAHPAPDRRRRSRRDRAALRPHPAAEPRRRAVPRRRGSPPLNRHRKASPS